MTTNAIQSSHIYSTYFAPRGRSRIYTLGMQIAQLYLSPFDQIIGFIGEAGSGKSVLIKGMFPGIELTNDDDAAHLPSGHPLRDGLPSAFRTGRCRPVGCAARQAHHH